jgi:hypothetical protein
VAAIVAETAAVVVNVAVAAIVAETAAVAAIATNAAKHQIINGRSPKQILKILTIVVPLHPLF